MILFIISGPLGTLLVFFGSLFIGTEIYVFGCFLNIEASVSGVASTRIVVSFSCLVGNSQIWLGNTQILMGNTRVSCSFFKGVLTWFCIHFYPELYVLGLFLHLLGLLWVVGAFPGLGDMVLLFLFCWCTQYMCFVLIFQLCCTYCAYGGCACS